MSELWEDCPNCWYWFDKSQYENCPICKLKEDCNRACIDLLNKYNREVNPLKKAYQLAYWELMRELGNIDP